MFSAVETAATLTERRCRVTKRDAATSICKKKDKQPKTQLWWWGCCAYLSGPLDVQVNQSFAIVLRPALNLLDLLEVGEKNRLWWKKHRRMMRGEEQTFI